MAAWPRFCACSCEVRSLKPRRELSAPLPVLGLSTPGAVASVSASSGALPLVLILQQSRVDLVARIDFSIMSRKRGRRGAEEQAALEALKRSVSDFKDDPFGLHCPAEPPRKERGRGAKQSCDPRQMRGLGERSGIWSTKSQVTGAIGVDPLASARGRQRPSGLLNLGATCYLSSLLQCLYHDRAFRRHVYGCRSRQGGAGDSMELESAPAAAAAASGAADVTDLTTEGGGVPERTLVAVLQRIFAEMQLSLRVAVNPLAFVQKLGLAKDTQQDPQEFNRLLMTHLEPMLGAMGAANPVNRLFVGKLRYITTCQRCERNWTRDETYADLQLSVSSPDGALKSVEECLARFFESEHLVGANQYACETCAARGDGKADATRRIRLVQKELPQRLTLLLMRFVYDPAAQRKKKLTHAIQIPENLDILPYLEEHAGSPTKHGGNSLANLGASRRSETAYKLRAVLHHSGADNAGHYTADVRCAVDSFARAAEGGAAATVAPTAQRAQRAEAKWWHFDDESVTTEKAKSWAAGKGSKSAYMLVYDRVEGGAEGGEGEAEGGEGAEAGADVGELPIDARRVVERGNAALESGHAHFESRKAALEKRMSERKSFHAVHFSGEAGDEVAHAAAVEDDDVFVPVDWLRSWVTGADLISDALREERAALPGEQCTTAIAFTPRLLCRHERLSAMEVRLRCKVLPRATVERMLSPTALEASRPFFAVSTYACDPCARELVEQCQQQVRLRRRQLRAPSAQTAARD